MTDIIRINEPVNPVRELIHHLNNYSIHTPDWSRNTMNYVNELHNQFFGWLPPVGSYVPSTQGDPVTWVILGIIAIILIYKL